MGASPAATARRFARFTVLPRWVRSIETPDNIWPLKPNKRRTLPFTFTRNPLPAEARFASSADLMIARPSYERASMETSYPDFVRTSFTSKSSVLFNLMFVKLAERNPDLSDTMLPPAEKPLPFNRMLLR